MHIAITLAWVKAEHGGFAPGEAVPWCLSSFHDKALVTGDSPPIITITTTTITTISPWWLTFMVVLEASVGIMAALWGVMQDVRRLAQLVRAWRAAGPHTTFMGKVQHRLATTWWLGPLRLISLRECGILVVGGSWWEVCCCC